MRALLATALLASVPLAAATKAPAVPDPASLTGPYEAGTIADPMFQKPYVDIDEWRDGPVRHRYIHGGFAGTETRFSFYFPDRAHYGGRFFQHITPVPQSENLAQSATGEEDRIGFSIASGGAFVETNGGGAAATAMAGRQVDPTIAAWRANAASAAFARVVAQRLYGEHRVYGYAYGGSGGAFRTVGGIENTKGVWDGVVPYVLGSPMAIPNVFTVRMQALRILKDKFPRIVDAMEPGGSGDPYAGLNAEEAAALREVSRMGFPPRSWFGWKTMGPHGFAALFQGMVLADASYFTDFWTKPRYLGANPPASLLAARVQHATTVVAPLSAAQARAVGIAIEASSEEKHGGVDNAFKVLIDGSAGPAPVGLRLASPPPAGIDLTLADLVVTSGTAAGTRFPLRHMAGDVALVSLGFFGDPRQLAAIKPGDAVMIDNSNFLASQSYHRHQDPGPQYKVWDQFRRADGSPIYPQRPMLLGPIFTANASGAVPSGKFDGKMIVVASLLDREAYPWQADWYRARVAEHFGAATDEHFRLWYTDNALHGDSEVQQDPARTVSYLGVLHQALRDLAAWVERGKAPPGSTIYWIEDGQVIVPPTAAERRGIQPVVTLRARGRERIEVKAGEAVRFEGIAEAPAGTGAIVSAQWDFEGGGRYAETAKLPTHPQPTARIEASHSFARPGIYFPVLRVAAQRDGDAATAFGRIQNIGRVRVIVK